MTEPADTLTAVAQLIAQIAAVEIDPFALTRETRLDADLSLDSISLISLMALTEERFGLSFAAHTDAVSNLRTLGDAVDLVDGLLAERETVRA